MIIYCKLGFFFIGLTFKVEIISLISLCYVYVLCFYSVVNSSKTLPTTTPDSWDDFGVLWDSWGYSPTIPFGVLFGFNWFSYSIICCIL